LKAATGEQRAISQINGKDNSKSNGKTSPLIHGTHG
jgi:hypothetical protein